MKKEIIRLTESQFHQIIKESVKSILKEDSTRIEMGRGELTTEASYNRIDDALEVLKQIADTMSENGYYGTEESALRSQINYIEQEIDYLRQHNT